MRVLAIDTALDACQAALVEDGRTLAARSEPMQRGHQERLAPLVREVMAAAGQGFETLDRLAVTVGPGSFTGLRMGLAFAKGLGLALDLPCVGVGTLEALAASASGEDPSAAVIDARRERVYLQLFRDGRPASDPELLDIEQARAAVLRFRSEAGPVRLLGPGARLLDETAQPTTLVPDAAAIARLAAEAREPIARPVPLYLRAPDAKTIAERAAAGPP